MRIPPCTHRPPCPGCPRYGEKGIAASAAALLEELAARSGATLDAVVEGAPLGYRVRARLAVRGRAASPKLGIFQEGSHNIADIPNCNIQHPRINAAARAIRAAMRSAGVPPYAERPHVGLLRYVQVVVERPSGRVQVALVANDVCEKSLQPMAAELVRALGDKLQGLWWNGNTGRGNAIFGEDWRLLAGEEAVRESIGGAEVFFPPGAFGQSNLDLADRLVADVHSRVPDGAIVADLYCGVGAFGLGLLGRASSVRFNEVNPAGLRGLAMGLAAMPRQRSAAAVVAPGDAATCAEVIDGASVVIVDPPRKGLDDAVIGALGRAHPATLLYVSCDPDSLVRDVARLTAAGRFRLRRLTPYALFPQTDHVETLAHLEA
ncbi:MAG: hypothetical protein ABR538_15660 [Candidatus Binatia bacterium]